MVVFQDSQDFVTIQCVLLINFSNILGGLILYGSPIVGGLKLVHFCFLPKQAKFDQITEIYTVHSRT